MIELYHTILEEPILNLLVFLYNILWNDVGLAIVAVTIIIRLLLYPSFHKSLKSQKELQELQPKLEEIREKYKDDQQKQMQEIMELYKEHKVNPFSSCLPLLVQLPILLALFNVLRNQLPKETIEGLYGFVSNPGALDPIGFGIVNLAERSIILALVAAGLQFIQTRMLQARRQPTAKTGGTAVMMQKQMMYFLPVMTFIFAMSLPSGLAVYWAITTLFAIGQQWVIMKKRDNESGIVNEGKKP